MSTRNLVSFGTKKTIPFYCDVLKQEIQEMEIHQPGIVLYKLSDFWLALSRLCLLKSETYKSFTLFIIIHVTTLLLIGTTKGYQIKIKSHLFVYFQIFFLIVIYLNKMKSLLLID